MNKRYAGWGSGAILLALLSWSSPAGGQIKANDAQMVKDFESRISAYMELHNKEAGAKKSTDSAEKLAQQHEEISKKIRAARADAKQGNIFSPEIADYFRRQIAATLAGHDGSKIKTSLHHAEPVQGINVQVNGKYPEKIPLQSTPPTLLLNLPRLPRELQYRIVNRDLLLYDPGADLIVDLIPDAIPTL
jgi:chorismate mutase